MKSLLFKVSSALLVLLIYIPIFFMAGSVFAEDVLILHQSYGNTHNKWKNRLASVEYLKSITCS